MKLSQARGALKQVKLANINWKIVGLVSLGLTAVILLYGVNLANLTGGYSVHEKAAAAGASSLTVIWQNPLAAPHKLLSYAYSQLVNPLLAVRMASASFAIIALVLFYRLILHWHNYKVAIWASLLFASSASLLHFGRWAGFGILGVTALLGLIIMSLGLKYHLKNHSSSRLLWLVATCVVCLYVPGLVWFVLLLAALKYRLIWRWLQKFNRLHRGLAVAAAVILLMPLFWYVVQNPLPNLLSFLGLNQHVSGLGQAGSQLLKLPIYFVYGGYQNAELWLGKLALVDAFTAITGLLGAYYYISRYRKLSRSLFLALAMVIAIILTVVSNFYLLPLLLVMIFIGVAGGLEELRRRWFAVFPRNPLARAFGVTLLSVVVATSVFYNLRSYYVAWPNAPATKQVYVIKS